MEVAGGDDHVLVREDVRVVRGGIDLVLDHRLDIHDVVLHGAVDLRDAAETVGILHVLLGPADEFAAFQGGHELLAGLDLARVGADEVRQRQERFDAAVLGVQGHRGDAVRPG